MFRKKIQHYKKNKQLNLNERTTIIVVKKMNTPNPLIPQGILSQTRGKTNIRIVVFTILALHVVLLGGLLMQGCKPEAKKEAKENELATNGLPLMAPYEPNTNLPAETPLPTLAQNTNVPVTPIDTLAPITPAPVGPTTEYAVRKNDSLAKIAKAKGVTLKALQQANPGVDPRKLKVGQKIQVPAPAGGADAGAAVVSDAGVAAPTHVKAATSTYVVKAGDSLAKIARQHGTTAKAIQAANNLKTTRINAGQKLKLPAAKSTVAKADLVGPGHIPTVANSNQAPVGSPTHQ
jgi:LysM repeat protein